MRKICLFLLVWGWTSLPCLAAVGHHAGRNPGRALSAILSMLLVFLVVVTGWLALTLLYTVLRPQTVIAGSEKLCNAPWRTFGTAILAIVTELYIGSVWAVAQEHCLTGVRKDA